MPVPYSHSQPDPQNGWKGLPASSTAPDGGNGPGQTSSYPLKANTEWSIWGPVDRVEHFFGSVYDRTLEAAHDLKEKERRIEDIAKAAWRADSVYCDAAVRKRIGMEFDELKRGFLSGLLYCLAIVAATTFVGATLGALLGGILTAGTAAIPAAIGGGELGFDAGMLILDAIGIGFLLKKLYNEIPKVFELIKHGVNTAWNAGSNRGHSAEQDIDAAARELADAEAELVAIILQGILLWILSESAVSKAGKIGAAVRQTASDMGALNTPATLAARGEELMQALKNSPAAARAALDAAAAELVTTLRKGGRLTEGLADFIEKRKEQILKSATEDVKKQIPKPKSGSGGGDSGKETVEPNVPRKPAKLAEGFEKRARPPEVRTAQRLSQDPRFDGRTFEAPPPPDPGYDWTDDQGRTYDALGDGSKSQYLNMDDFEQSINKHLLKGNDFTVIDLTGYTPEQIAEISNYVNSLPAASQAEIVRVGF